MPTLINNCIILCQSSRRGPGGRECNRVRQDFPPGSQQAQVPDDSTF